MRIGSRIGLVSVLFGLLVGATAQAAEVSLVSGLYRKEDNKVAGNDAGGKSEVSAGGRFSEQLDSHMFWFGQGLLSMRSYSKGDAPDAPSDSTSLSLGGGIRYYFNKLAENVSPFVDGLGEYRSEKDGTTSATSTTENEQNGLYYGGFFGIRLSLDKEFFVDFEARLFDSALFATETSETTTSGPTGKTTTKDEKKKTELYAQSTGDFNTMLVAVGLRL